MWESQCQKPTMTGHALYQPLIIIYGDDFGIGFSAFVIVIINQIVNVVS